MAKYLDPQNKNLMDLITLIIEQNLKLKDSTDKNEKDLYKKLCDLLSNVDEIRTESSEDNYPNIYKDLTDVLSATSKALVECADQEQSRANAQILAELSIRVSGKPSSAWKGLGASLLFLASAVLVVAGVLLAIPTGGISLLLSVIGKVGLTASIGAGAGAVASGAMGAASLYHGREKGLAKALNSFTQSLNEMAAEELLIPFTSESSSESNSESNSEPRNDLSSSQEKQPDMSSISTTPKSNAPESEQGGFANTSQSPNSQNELPQSSSTGQIMGAPALEGQTQKMLPSISAVVSDVVYQQIIKTINTSDETNPEASLNFKSSQSNSDIFSDLKHNIRICERLKHPHPTWIYTRVEPKQEGEKAIIKIKYTPTPSDSLTKEQLDSKIKYSIMTRKLSILGGVLTLLDYPDYLTTDPDQKQAIRARLSQLSKEVIDSECNDLTPDPKEEINNFIASLASTLEVITNPKPDNIIREIREAERYFVAEHNKNQILIVEIPKGNKTIVQMDIELNHQLTEEQKKSYLAIHDESQQPKWFQALRPAEQAWYRDRIPQHNDPQIEQKWSDFQLLFKSSAMTHTPGLPNARVNYLMTQEENKELNVINASVKSGTPVCYEMPSEEQAKHSEDNAQQLVSYAKKLAATNNQQLWGEFFKHAEPPAVPILVQSLLSKKIKKMWIEITEADNNLIQGQDKAMQNLKEEGFHIMYHNDGTNGFSRGNKICMKGDPQFDQLVAFAKNFLVSVNKELAEQNPDANPCMQIEVDQLFDNEGEKKEQQELLNLFIKNLETNLSFTAEQKASISTILRVLDEYHHHDAASQLSRNKAEYIVSLKKMLVEAMGGAVTNNCKSGKDRTGQSEVYQHAFTLTMLDHPSEALLHYDESGDRRDWFCENAGILLGSQKIQESAGLNTLGCVGTKAPELSLIVDDDVRKEKHFGRLHKLGCTLASMNKPTAFSKDEKDKAMEEKKTTNNTKDMKTVLFNMRKPEPDCGAREGFCNLVGA